MRAASISIQTTTRRRCNAQCKFCISKMTMADIAPAEAPKKCDLRRLEVGLGYAECLGATHAILTGKADPTQEETSYLSKIIELARRHVPLVDMHTNGFLFQREQYKETSLPILIDYGLTMITFSLAHWDENINYNLTGLHTEHLKLIRMAADLGLMVRVSVVLCKPGINNSTELVRAIEFFKECGAHSVIAREMWIPDAARDVETAEWCKENRVYRTDIVNYIETIKDVHFKEKLPWGAYVYEVAGIQLTVMRCQDNFGDGVLRSIVHKPNGHGYGNWDSEATIFY